MKMHLFNGSIKYGMFRNINMAELSCDLGIILFSAVLPLFGAVHAGISAVCAVFLPILLGNIMYYTLHKEIVPETQSMVTGVMAMVLILMGPIAGFMFTSKRAAGNNLFHYLRRTQTVMPTIFAMKSKRLQLPFSCFDSITGKNASESKSG